MGQGDQTKQRIAKVILLPKGLFDPRNTVLLRRGIALTICLLGISLFMLLLSVAFTALAILTGIELGTEILVLWTITILMCLQTLAFYRFANLRIAGMLIMATYLLITLSVVVFSGGYESPLLPILLCTVVISFRFGSQEDGFMSTFYVGIAVLALVSVHLMEVPSITLIAGLPSPILFVMGWLAVLTTLSICLGTYAYDRED